MAADVEQKALIARRAADAADVIRVFLQDHNVAAVLGQSVSCGQPGGAGPDNDRLDNLAHVSPEPARRRGRRLQACSYGDAQGTMENSR